MTDTHKAKVSGITLDNKHRLSILEEHCVRKYKLTASNLVTLCDQLIHKPEEVPRNALVQYLVDFSVILIVNFGSCNSPSLMPHYAQAY